MIWLSGGLGRVIAAEPRHDLGVMCQPRTTHAPQLAQIRQSGIWWATDNGVYGGRFDPVRWERWLEAAPRAARLTCLFAVAPDVLHRVTHEDGTVTVHGDAMATRERFDLFAPILRRLAYRVAFVSQDGAMSALVPWDDIDCLFVGGSDTWKLCDQSVSLIREAQQRGLWTHMGRCQARGGAGGRFGAAHALGIDSGDGTVLARDPSRLRRVQRGLTALNAQIALEAV